MSKEILNFALLLRMRTDESLITWKKEESTTYDHHYSLDPTIKDSAGNINVEFFTFYKANEFYLQLFVYPDNGKKQDIEVCAKDEGYGIMNRLFNSIVQKQEKVNQLLHRATGVLNNTTIEKCR